MPTGSESDKLVAVILAGGRSSRFGRDKAREPVEGVPSLERIRSACLSAGLSVVVDERPTEGPLGAIVAYTSDVIVLACDMPFIDAALIARLAAPLDHDARIPRTPTPQPLAARYTPRALAKLRDAHTSGQRSIVKALDQLAIEWLDDMDPNVLDDFDTPTDLARLQSGRRNPDAV